MINKRVKTLFKGMVAAPALLVKECEETGQSLCIWYEGDCMELSSVELVKNLISVSDRPFRDKFGGEPYYLYYYAWKPTVIQTKLFEGIAYAT